MALHCISLLVRLAEVLVGVYDIGAMLAVDACVKDWWTVRILPAFHCIGLCDGHQSFRRQAISATVKSATNQLGDNLVPSRQTAPRPGLLEMLYTRETFGDGATVVQVGDSFQHGRHDHLDAPVLGVYDATQVRANIKSAATADVFKSAADIVVEELTSIFSQNGTVPCEGFPNPEVLVRAANRARQRLNSSTFPATARLSCSTCFVLSIRNNHSNEISCRRDDRTHLYVTEH